MRKKEISLKSFLARYAGLFKEERDIVNVLMLNDIIIEKWHEKELEKYSSLVVMKMIDIEKKERWNDYYYRIVLREFE